MGLDESKSVGERIALCRDEKGISAQALSELAGCSEEYLQWVEDNQVEPPVALLIRLAKSMKLDPSTFLTPEDSRNKRLDEETKRTGTYSYETLTPSEPDKHLMAFLVKIPPKTAHEGVGYLHEGEEFVYVLSGEVELTVDQEKTVLKERESLRFNSAFDHHLSNSGAKEAELLITLYVP
jgi:electron transfer flavoprotein alpha subunit